MTNIMEQFQKSRSQELLYFGKSLCSSLRDALRLRIHCQKSFFIVLKS